MNKSQKRVKLEYLQKNTQKSARADKPLVWVASQIKWNTLLLGRQQLPVLT